MGRHVKRLEFLDVLLGDRPALTPVESFYQRILAGDADEAQDHAELLLKERSLSTYYDEVALKGLQLAANDAQRGVLDHDQLDRVKATVKVLVEGLGGHEDKQPPQREARRTSAVDRPTTRRTCRTSRRRSVDPRRRGAAAALARAGRGAVHRRARSAGRGGFGHAGQLLGKHGMGARAGRLRARCRATRSRRSTCAGARDGLHLLSRHQRQSRASALPDAAAARPSADGRADPGRAVAVGRQRADRRADAGGDRGGLLHQLAARGRQRLRGRGRQGGCFGARASRRVRCRRLNWRGLFAGGAALAWVWPALAADPDGPGREFPKTLIFDEPGIDDEISVPTLIVIPRGAPAGRETDVDFELDKRLTTWLSLQINDGYVSIPGVSGRAQGWQNLEATLKSVLLDDPAMERLVSLSLTTAFGGSGAARIGAERGSTSIAAVNFGQGWSPLAGTTLLKPVAITGSFGYALPDGSDGTTRQAVLSASLQYSFAVLTAGSGAGFLPPAMRPLIPIVECVVTAPARGQRVGTLAPGLIYAGQGYQLAAEALLPLTKAAGAHAGFIAQLNISLASFGWPALARVFRQTQPGVCRGRAQHAPGEAWRLVSGRGAAEPGVV